MKIKFFSKIEMAFLVVVIIFAATFTNVYAFNPVTPTPISPGNYELVSVQTPPTFVWSTFIDPDGDTQRGYHLRVRCDDCDPNKDITVYDTGFIADTSANSHTYSVGAYSGVDPVTLHPLESLPLASGKRYHWHVRYMDSAGEWSDYSAESPRQFFITPGFAPFPEDTISLWHLDETSGPDYVDAFDGNKGTGDYDPTADLDGLVNGTQEFNGVNTGIVVPADQSFDWLGTDSFSIEFWVKTKGTGALGSNQVIIGRDDVSTMLHWWVGLNEADGRPSFVLRDSGGNGSGLLGVGKISLADGKWHHVVAVRDLGTGDNILYVDGNVQGRTHYDYPYTAWFGSNDAALNIGWLNLSHGYHFKGLIDEVAIYDRALTPTEIKDHYLAGVAGESIESLRPRPVADAGDDQPNVKETTVVSLNGTASQAGYAESSIVYHLWVQLPGGTPVTLSGATTATATFTAPDVSAAGETLSFRLTVTADDGQSDIDSVDIAVVNIVAPVANAGVDQIETEGDPITLDGSGSSDADGTIATYLWEQVTGTPVTLPGASTTPTATFNAPQVGPAGETLTFQLTVTDDDGLSSSDTVSVTVNNNPRAPTADAGDDQNVAEGDPVMLDGSGSSDADGTIDIYLWDQLTGTPVTLPGASTTPTATFTAPQVGPAGETLEFELTVTDDDGLASTDKVTVNITDKPVNCNLPSAPNSITYPPGSNDGSFIVSWSSVSAAGSYTLQRATDASFSAATTVYSGSSTFYSVTGLDAGTYYFRVRATNNCGSSDWKAGGNGIGVGSDIAEIEAFVTRFYELCLGRLPDSAGLNGWVNALLNGTKTGADVARGFIFSPEFTNKNTTAEEYIAILYEAFFNRIPDSAGFQGWLDAMNSGASREDVLNGFIYALEFNNLCWEYGILPNPVAAFVARFYQRCLNRNPERDGLDGWVNNLLNQIQAGADVAEGFIYSPEFIDKNTTNSEYLLILYKAFFNRDADQAGWDKWLAELNSGRDRGQVLNGFIYSQEFAALCNDYGIIPSRRVDPEHGSLQVTLKPQLAVDEGAGWKVDGGGWQASDVTISPLSVGDHRVSFKPISGWETPKDQTVTINLNDATIISGTYVKTTTGSLKVTIAVGPPAARWNVDGGAWQRSGVTISVSVGDHMVQFKPISGWDAPAREKVTITSNTITRIAREYKEEGNGQ